MGALRATWHVLYRRGGRGTLPKVEIDGPGVDDLVHDLLWELAHDIIEGSTRADLWSDFLMAETALHAAEDEDGNEVAIEYLIDQRDNAWAALVPELPNVVRMSVAEAQLVAHQVDEHVGRVGTSWRAA